MSPVVEVRPQSRSDRGFLSSGGRDDAPRSNDQQELRSERHFFMEVDAVR